MTSWSRSRADALSAARELCEILDEIDADSPTLIASYLAAKRALANAFADLAQERYGSDRSLDEAISLVEVALGSFESVPEKYRRVRSFSASHRIILGYLRLNVGAPVTAATLRMINREQVHTERRTRELRTLGFDLEATRTAGHEAYVLRSPLPNAALGALRQIEHRIREDRDLNESEREELLLRYASA